MKIIKAQLLENFKFLSLISLILFNFNLSAMHLNLFGHKKDKDKAAGAGHPGAMLTSTPAAVEHAHAGVGASGDMGVGAGGGAGAGGASDAASSGSRASGVPGSSAGVLFNKSHSDGDLSTLLARTAAKMTALEASVSAVNHKADTVAGKVDALGAVVGEETALRAGALTRLDGRVSELAATAAEHDQAVAARFELLQRSFMADWETRDVRIDALEQANRDEVVATVAVPVETFEGGKLVAHNILLKDRRSFELYQMQRQNAYDHGYNIGQRDANVQSQDNTHADDKKLFESTPLAGLAESTREKVTELKESLTPRNMAIVAGVVLVACLLARHHFQKTNLQSSGSKPDINRGAK